MTFLIFSCFLHPTRCCLVPSRKASSCLPRRAVGAKRLADLWHNRGFMARSRRTPAMRVGRCSSELSGHRLRGKLKKSQPLSGALLSPCMTLVLGLLDLIGVIPTGTAEGPQGTAPAVGWTRGRGYRDCILVFSRPLRLCTLWGNHPFPHPRTAERSEPVHLPHFIPVNIIPSRYGAVRGKPFYPRRMPETGKT